jgi:hypothetical protein
MANTDVSTHHALMTISAREIQSLADRLYGRGVSTLTTCDPRCRGDLIQASRVIRGLLRRYEHSTGSELVTLMIAGG